MEKWTPDDVGPVAHFRSWTVDDVSFPGSGRQCSFRGVTAVVTRTESVAQLRERVLATSKVKERAAEISAHPEVLGYFSTVCSTTDPGASAVHDRVLNNLSRHLETWLRDQCDVRTIRAGEHYLAMPRLTMHVNYAEDAIKESFRNLSTGPGAAAAQIAGYTAGDQRKVGYRGYDDSGTTPDPELQGVLDTIVRTAERLYRPERRNTDRRPRAHGSRQPDSRDVNQVR